MASYGYPTIPATPGFCCDCSHLLGKRHDLGNVEAWRCHHPANVSAKRHNLVTGVPITELKETSLDDLRSNQYKCGPEGVWFELYVPPSYTSTPVATTPAPAPAKVLTTSLKARLAKLGAEDL